MMNGLKWANSGGDGERSLELGFLVKLESTGLAKTIVECEERREMVVTPRHCGMIFG
jgi:hypothetical protein